MSTSTNIIFLVEAICEVPEPVLNVSQDCQYSLSHWVSRSDASV